MLFTSHVFWSYSDGVTFQSFLNSKTIVSAKKKVNFEPFREFPSEMNDEKSYCVVSYVFYTYA